MPTPLRSTYGRRAAMRFVATALACLAAATHARAQDWPTRPIRVIVPYPPGGPSEIVVRAVAEQLTGTLGQPVVLDNRPGAGGNIGTDAAAHAPPDGYTWAVITDTVLTINPFVYKRMGFKREDFAAITYLADFTQMLVCNPSIGVKTVGELVARARASRMSYASGGYGVPGHMAMEMLLATAGVSMDHVPYKGPAPAMQDVIGGQVPCGFLATPTVAPQVKAGRLVALATSGARRSPMTQDVPTVAEAGYPGYDATFSLVLLVPRGTPDPLRQRIHDAVRAALARPEVVAKLTSSDQQAVGNSAADAEARLTRTAARWHEIVKKIDLQLD